MLICDVHTHCKRKFIEDIENSDLTNSLDVPKDEFGNHLPGYGVPGVGGTATIGEKLSFRRFEVVEKNDDEIFGSYLHLGGKIASLVVLNGGNDEVAKDVAMQAAAMNPTALRRDGVPAEVVERESHIIKEQVMAEGKPEEIAEKMEELYPDCDVELQYGGQPIYYYIVSVE